MLLAYYTHNLSPYLIHFWGPYGIRYYGLAYALGFLVLYGGLIYQNRRGWSQLHGEGIPDFVTWMIIGVVVGGRLIYCLLYGWERTRENPLSIFYVWEGGMASHGGILGSICAIAYCARKNKIPFYNLADATAICCPLALFMGRIANFINGELWGRPSTMPWAVIFPDAPPVNGLDVPRHPSQLYEALLEGVVLFLILVLLRSKVKRDGIVALTFMAGYAVMRIICECFREPDLQIGYYAGIFTQGQLLSAGMLLGTIALWILWWNAHAVRR